MNKLLKLNPVDEVAVALQDIKAGEQLEIDGQKLVAKDDILHGHKIALVPIANGAPVIKYGFPIGKATADIAVGEHVHIHNMHTNMKDHEHYEYHPDIRPLKQVLPETFRGYVRKDGRAAIRNEVWIIPGVGCVGDLSSRLARENQHLVEKYGLDGLYAFPHPFGCSQVGEDNLMTRRLLATLVNHPNAGGVLVVSLGCENNVPKDFQQAIIDIAGDSWDPDRVKFMICQDVEDEIAEGGKLLEQVAEYASQFHREDVSVTELVLGMKCGGSDGLSGITANPVLGALGDMLVARGGSSMITEVPEMFGGGKASLILEDKSAPLECGIEIRVQPPGKQVKTITLLSGGEKAFVAIALYFAILKVRPTPFCMLDEIDAALDDRNVERFASYLHTLSDKTQFIVITHRRGTMEAADVLYGVTMQEQGVSKILRLSLDELAKQLGITA